MQTPCRKSLIWIVPFLVVGIVGWGGAQRAEAADAPDLSWLQDDACAEGAAVAELDAPAWEADATPTPATGDTIGGKACATNGQCKGKQYCSKPVGECKGKGECKTKPDVCPLIFKPVCGCNGKTYSNECFAALAGVNVKAEGACKKPTGGDYTCKTNKDCPAGNFCAKDMGKCDDAGVCAQKPHGCPMQIVAPVCGCNDKTYNNVCLAHAAGVSVKHDGKCEK
jgi:hypothetical protein